jgi:thermostable 8-oxoguanine DNA glycosylase
MDRGKSEKQRDWSMVNEGTRRRYRQMPTTSVQKAVDFRGDLKGFLKDFRFQPSLTEKLDRLDGVDFDQSLINEIVLWKVNRYVSLKQSLMKELDDLRTLSQGEHRKSKSVLNRLLNTHGVDLPMASTLLRFRNPDVFQIIDRHAYRAVYGIPFKLYTATSIERKMDTYFLYLDALLSLCQSRSLDFSTVDRLLYIFDKKKNGSLTARVPRISPDF